MQEPVKIAAHWRRHCATDISARQIYFISAVQTWVLEATLIGLYFMRRRSTDLLISGGGYSPMVETQMHERIIAKCHSIWRSRMGGSNSFRCYYGTVQLLTPRTM